MVQINIYKISENKIDELNKYVTEIYGDAEYKKSINYNSDNDDDNKYDTALYILPAQKKQKLKWEWVFSLFDVSEKFYSGSSPKGLLTFSKNKNMYVLTFGYSYFKIDLFSDKNWAFDFARRLEYENVKTTALTCPYSKRNKIINTYLNTYDNIEFESGDAFTKLKITAKLSDDFKLFKNTIEFGNSIKFSTIGNHITLEKIIEIIEHVNSVICNDPEVIKIPCFYQIKDTEIISEYYNKLMKKIEIDNINLDFSEFQINATNITFIDSLTFEYKYNRYSKKIDEINNVTLSNFLTENSIDIHKTLDIKINGFDENGNYKFTKKISELIYYTDEKQEALLSEGVWYKYNDDYINYLNDSISNINCVYEPDYNYYKSKKEEYISKIFDNEKHNAIYSGLSDEEIKDKIRANNYRELIFNKLRTEENGYELYDRKTERIGNHLIEIMDLYKDKTMYAVKFGSSSSELCYALDQSLESAKYCHKHPDTNFEFKNVCVWLILDRTNELPVDDNNVPKITELKMLILKNKIDVWRKEIIRLGYTPTIRINYVMD